MNDEDDGPSGLFDHEAIGEIMEKLADAIRPLGLTLLPGATVMADVASGEQVLQCGIVIRPSAKKRLSEDRASKAEFNQMMAANAAAQIEEESEKIRRELLDIDKAFSGEDDEDGCQHLRRHPSDGFCLDCRQGL